MIFLKTFDAVVVVNSATMGHGCCQSDRLGVQDGNES